MEAKSIEHLVNVLLNWSSVHVRTVPGVMYQVLCGKSNADNHTEYRFHWFLDCTETYVHNHQYAFDTYCLDGEYTEKIWKVVDDQTGTSTYRFRRTSGNTFEAGISVPGALRVINTNHHFPGNTLHVDPNQFHSISPKPGTSNEVLTFVARSVSTTAPKATYALSSTERITAPTDEIRAATFEEHELVYHKLLKTFQRILFNRKFK